MTHELNDGLTAPVNASGKWERAAWRIGVEVAGPAADDVDRLARFPHETVNALKANGFMGALLPGELGGGDATLSDLTGAVRALAVHCASSALVLAMHSIEVFNLARHGTTLTLQAVGREIASEQLLLANANSEVGVAGEACAHWRTPRVHGRWISKPSPSRTERTPTSWSRRLERHLKRVKPIKCSSCVGDLISAWIHSRSGIPSVCVAPAAEGSV